MNPDVTDIPDLMVSSHSHTTAGISDFQGAGGDFGGGGASASFGDSSDSLSSAAAKGTSGSKGGLADLSFDFDELALLLIAVGVFLSAVTIAIFVVISAPSLFADLLIDGFIAARLYRNVKGMERRNWVVTAFKQTWIKAALLLLVFTILGIAFQFYAPEARTMGEVWNKFQMNIGK